MEWLVQLNRQSEPKEISLEGEAAAQGWVYHQPTQRLIRTIASDGQATPTLMIERNLHLRAASVIAGRNQLAPKVVLELHCGRGYVHREEMRLRVKAPIATRAAGAAAGGPIEIESPLAGKVVKVLAQEGQAVTQGQAIMTVEAMKMENQIVAPRAGKVSSLGKAAGEQVQPGDLLAVIDPA